MLLILMLEKIESKYVLDIERIDINRLVKEMCDRYGKLIQRYSFKYQAIVSADVHK